MINKVFLIGNLGQDPETISFENGNTVTRFSIATNKRYQQNQDWKTKTSWHNVIAWNELGKRMSETLRKGNLVYIEGEISYREYEKDGEKRFVTDILAKVIRRLERSNVQVMMPSADDAQPVKNLVS